MVNVSKAGALSLIMGLSILLATYFIGFQQAGMWALIAAAITGAIVLAGIFLLVLGIIMLTV